MKRIFLKIKGINCHVEQEEKLSGRTEVFCYGNSKCDTCCGLVNCECNDKLIKRENHGR